MTTARIVRVLSLLWLATFGQSSLAGPMPLMRPLAIEAYQVVDAQYVPFVGSLRPSYPRDVLFGFYPSEGTDAAVACAELSFLRVERFLRSDDSNLARFTDQGGTPNFYLWINDYSLSNPRYAYRPARLWHFNYGSQDYRTGYWYWEATLTLEGFCELPTSEQVKAAVDEGLDWLGTNVK